MDDDKDTLYTFDIYLKSIGYRIVSFVNPVEALDFFERNFTNCALVITDYSNPQISGLDLIKKIREKDSNSNIKTMIVSAYVKDDLFKDNFYMKRIDKIIEKPVDVDTLKKITNLTNDKIL